MPNWKVSTRDRDIPSGTESVMAGLGPALAGPRPVGPAGSLPPYNAHSSRSGLRSTTILSIVIALAVLPPKYPLNFLRFIPCHVLTAAPPPRAPPRAVGSSPIATPFA